MLILFKQDICTTISKFTLSPSVFMAGKWECPWHHCDVCGKPSISFCHFCPNSFCKDHQDETLLSSNLNGQLVCSDHIGEKIAEKKAKTPPRKLTALKRKRRQRNKWKRTECKQQRTAVPAANTVLQISCEQGQGRTCMFARMGFDF